MQLQLRYQTCINNKHNFIIYSHLQTNMVWKSQANFFLIAINIVALSLFQYPPPSWTLPIYFVLAQINFSDDMKKKMQVVSICSLVSSFVVIPWIADFFSICALGLAMNVGYRIDSFNAPWVVNSSVGLGVILGNIFSANLVKYHTGRDMVILICTLPNLFMAQNTIQKKGRATLWFFNPFYDRTWTYAIGFIGGVFLPLSTINKHIRFLIISIILLMTIFVQGSVYEQILTLIRGFFIYDETRHQSELYFLVGFLIVDIFMQSYKFNYLFIGYLVISVMLWHKQQEQQKQKRNQKQLKQLLTQNKIIHQVQSD